VSVLLPINHSTEQLTVFKGCNIDKLCLREDKMSVVPKLAMLGLAATLLVRRGAYNT